MSTLPSLQFEEIHLWRADLNLLEDVLAVLARVLSRDEREKVERLRFEHHRRRAIASRGILRCILSHYLQVRAEEMQFCYGSKGKPDLVQAINPQALSFNVTHSENLALYAIAINTPIGVDVEFQKPISLLPQLIERYFSPKERHTIMALPLAQQESCFYFYWTAKESLTKATGQGISDLSTIEIEVLDQEVIGTYCHFSPEIKWQMLCIQPQAHYVASVAYAAPQPRRFLFFNWEMD